MPNLQRLDLAAVIAETIIPEMELSARASGLPEKFIRGITLTAISPTRFKITNTWESETGAPLAKFFEWGTRDHWIEPKSSDGVLVWASQGPESGHSRAIYSKRYDNIEGQMLFSKGHYVTGLPRTDAMSIGFRLGTARLRKRLELDHG